MAILISYPNSFCLAGNIQPIVVESSSPIVFKLFKGDVLLLDESYTPDPFNKVEIDIRDVVYNSLSFNFPNTNIYQQPNVSAVFTIHVDAIVKTFTAVKAAVRSFLGDASNFLLSHFLTSQPQAKRTLYSQLEYITYYAVQQCTLVCRYIDNNIVKTINLASLDPGKVYTINVSYAHIASLIAPAVAPNFFDIYVYTTEKISYTQRYYLYDNGLFDDHFLFENTLGGLDSVVLSGITEKSYSSEYKAASYGRMNRQLPAEDKFVFSKNSGYITSYEIKWLYDLYSTKSQNKKYVINDGQLSEIVINTLDLSDKTNDDLKSFKFEYALCDYNYQQSIDRDFDELELQEMTFYLDAENGELVYETASDLDDIKFKINQQGHLIAEIS